MSQKKKRNKVTPKKQLQEPTISQSTHFLNSLQKKMLQDDTNLTQDYIHPTSAILQTLVQHDDQELNKILFSQNQESIKNIVQNIVASKINVFCERLIDLIKSNKSGASHLYSWVLSIMQIHDSIISQNNLKQIKRVVQSIEEETELGFLLKIQGKVQLLNS